MTKPILSILFLAWNGLNPTKKALESIFKYTTVYYELILIDNGSIDGVEKYFDECKTDSLYCTKIQVIHNKENLGVSKGYNQGFPHMDVTTQYISIYSNDWICSPRWAQKMIACLDSEPMCGLATACCNWSATSMIESNLNPARMKRVELKWNDPDLFKKVEKINEIVEQKAKGVYTPNEFVCMGWLMKREVYDKVGLIDERIESANDVAYTYLALNHGYISKTCWDTYIHHFVLVSGSQIPNQERIDRDTRDWNRILTDELYKNGKKDNT